MIGCLLKGKSPSVTRSRELAVVDVEAFSPSVTEEPGKVDAVSLFILSGTLGVSIGHLSYDATRVST